MIARNKPVLLRMMAVAALVAFLPLRQPLAGCGALYDALYDIVAGKDFNTTRHIGDYLYQFREGFARDLRRLNGQSHWLDAGSGDGIAALSYLNQDSRGLLPLIQKGGAQHRDGIQSATQAFFSGLGHERARVTAVSYDRHLETVGKWADAGAVPREPPPGKIDFLTGRFFEDIPASEIGAVDLITDYYGVFSYSPKVTEVLSRYLELLKKDGTAYLLIDSRNSVMQFNGSRTPLAEWIRRIPGIEAEIFDDALATLQSNVIRDPSGEVIHESITKSNNVGRMIRIRKIREGPIPVPGLQLLESRGKAPPIQTFIYR